MTKLSLADKVALVGKTATVLGRNTNQARGIAKFAIGFMKGTLGAGPDDSVYDRVELFHTDSVVCGLSALALRTNAPTVLREEALKYKWNNGATVFGSNVSVAPEKVQPYCNALWFDTVLEMCWQAIAANSSAVREWDSNGTVFG